MYAPRRIITTVLATTVVLIAFTAPAIAYPIGPSFGVGYPFHHAAAVYSLQDKQVITPAATTAQPTAQPAQPVTHVNAPTGGFTALDAAITAAGALALLLLGIGGAAALSRRRGRGVRQPVAVTH
jgi:hypothetical protein